MKKEQKAACHGQAAVAQVPGSEGAALLLAQQIQKLKPGSTAVITQVSQQNIDTGF